MKRFLRVTLQVLLFCFLPFGGVHAALLTGSFTPGSGASYDLTAAGGLDWAYWSSTSTNSFSGTPSNAKSGGTLIGNLTAAGGSYLRGSNSSTKPVTDFSYSDGSSPASGSVTNISGVFNNNLGSLGTGAEVVITLPDAGTLYEVKVWVSGYAIGGGFNRTGLMTAALTSGGAAAFTDSSLNSDEATPKEDGFYTFSASSDVNGDTLTLNYVLANGAGANSSGNAHTILSAATVAVIPEAASAYYLLMAMGLVLVVLRKRK
ncbi:hypothetical protein P0Y35_09140 [Kiritimatiellaeota bacterium B1221]|nr:hypothetical protein [Kiritimatiellaeota bacterium B1221]